jgi:hypothetical protein
MGPQRHTVRNKFSSAGIVAKAPALAPPAAGAAGRPKGGQEATLQEEVQAEKKRAVALRKAGKDKEAMQVRGCAPSLAPKRGHRWAPWSKRMNR